MILQGQLVGTGAGLEGAEEERGYEGAEGTVDFAMLVVHFMEVP